jgi:hypothetical protein
MRRTDVVEPELTQGRPPEDLLTEELQDLGQGRGATTTQIDAAGDNLRRLGKVYRRKHPERYEDDSSAARGLLVQALTEFDDDLGAAADAGLGITVTGASLAARQRAVNQARATIKLPELSRSTFQRQAKEAWPRLAKRLLSLAYAEEVVALSHGGKATTIDLGYTIETLHALYRLVPVHRVDRVIFAVTLVPNRSGTLTYLAHHEYLNDRNDDALSVSALFGCQKQGQTFENGMLLAVLHLGDDLVADERYRLMYEVRVETNQPLLPLLTITADTDIKGASISVDFNSNQRCSDLIRFSGLTFPHSRSQAQRAAVGASVPIHRLITVDWADIAIGESFGLEWSWNDN